jgi:DNA-binding response OmpR family regulator
MVALAMNSPSSLALSPTAEAALAAAAQAAYQVALRHGLRGSFLECELELWQALRGALADELSQAPVCLELLPDRLAVRASGRTLTLTRTEFGVLQFLVAHAGQAFTRREIVEGVKGERYPVTDRAVDVQIVSLRRKLGALGRSIETVRGTGYRYRQIDGAAPAARPQRRKGAGR